MMLIGILIPSTNELWFSSAAWKTFNAQQCSQKRMFTFEHRNARHTAMFQPTSCMCVFGNNQMLLHRRVQCLINCSNETSVSLASHHHYRTIPFFSKMPRTLGKHTWGILCRIRNISPLKQFHCSLTCWLSMHYITDEHQQDHADRLNKWRPTFFE